MAAGDDERPERPEYNVYRGGSSRGKKGKGPARDKKGKPPKEAGGDGEPEYSVYRSSKSPLRKLRGANLAALRERFGRGERPGGGPEPARAPADGGGPNWRRILRFALIGAVGWFLLSVVLFAISAQIQSGKLDSGAADQLGGNPFLAASPQTILVMGTDVRPIGAPDETGRPTRKKCAEAAARGAPHPDDCLGTRADTLMLVRAGGGTFEKLSIPRDSYAAIPGQSSQKINAAYSFGGAALQIETVEDFLGIDVDRAIILDFEGFADFIDAIGGVKINLNERVKSKISGGAGNGGTTLKLDRGEHTLDGDQALALARTRSNFRNPTQDDTDRAARQQLILSGIKDRLTSPWRAPINFIRGPLIAWNAPKAMVSDMGALILPQLAFAAAIGGEGGSRILKPTGVGPAGSITVPVSQCEKAVKKFLGEAGPRAPTCSPLF